MSDPRPEAPLDESAAQQTATAEKPTAATPQEAPPAQPPVSAAKVGQEKWTAFESEIQSRAANIATMLPSTVSPERFINSTIAAVKQNPDLLFVNQRTLFAAIVKSAQDGLLPDGREGVITAYNTKVSKRGEPDKYEECAQWNPMVHGIRKRARECGGILIDAQVVYMQDKFLWEQGDNPRIEHTPSQLGTSRGTPIGAYAIFKLEDGTILAREVMDSEAINDTKAQSRAQKSLMWTTFWTEGWRKAVIRRGIKAVPSMDPKLAQVIQRDDEHFEFGEPTRFIQEGQRPDTGRRINQPVDQRRGPFHRQEKPPAITEQVNTTPKTAQPEAAAAGEAGSAAPAVQDAEFEDEAPLVRGTRLLTTCKTTNDVADLRGSITEELAPADVGGWNLLCDARSKALTNLGPKVAPEPGG